MVARIIEYVHAGDAFQVVLAQRFTVGGELLANGGWRCEQGPRAPIDDKESAAYSVAVVWSPE